jgi:toxin CptA
MPNSLRSSNASAGSRTTGCRIEWRPSRWLLAALALIAILAAFSLFESQLPRWLAWALAPLVLGYAAWTIRREARRPVREFVFPGNASPVLLDGRPVEGVSVHWRGPLAFVRWRGRDGRAGRLGWWPDTLPPAQRRELRLAAGAGDVSRNGRGMAP